MKISMLRGNRLKPGLRAVAGAMALVGAMGLVPGAAFGQEAAQSFNVTNRLDNGIVLTAYPTNGVGTNTGGAIQVGNYDRLGFYFRGYVSVASTGTVTLVRSPETPAASGTNFESVAQKTISIPMPTVGPFMYMTNLEPEFVRPANSIGINLLTNSVGSITNLDVGLTKKLIPIGTR